MSRCACGVLLSLYAARAWQPNMGFQRVRLGLFRVLAWPAAKRMLRLGALFLALGFSLGALRFLPWILGPGLPLGLGLLLCAELLLMSLEVAVFVAPPLACALTSAELHERGELRALFALGISPARVALSAWPVLLFSCALLGGASGLWGLVAASPAQRINAWIAEARGACERRAASNVERPAIVPIPSADFAWVCFPGEPARLFGALPLPLETAALSAKSIAFSSDLRTLNVRGAELFVQRRAPAASAPEDETTRLRVHAGALSIAGLLPQGRASNLHPWMRALLLSLSAGALALHSGVLVMKAAHAGRGRALLVGVSAVAAALLVFSSLERSPAKPLHYALVPALGLLAAWIAARLSYRRHPRGA